MERIKEIFSTFFDINSFSIRNLIIAIIILTIFLVFKGLLSRIIIKIFSKAKDKESIKKNSFYKPLKLFFCSLGLYLALISLGPTAYFKSIIVKVFRLIIILLATYAIGKLVSPKSRFEKALRKKMNKANDGMIKTICKTLKIVIYIVGALIVISELGFNVSTLLAGIGIGGVAIALAAQDTASNIIAALMIILDKPFEIGDWICVGTIEGSVEEVTFRSTRIREAQNTVVSIPNSTIVNNNITNWSRLQKRKISMNLVLDFNTSLKTVADVQNDILILLEQEENVIKDGYYVKFDQIAANGFDLKIFFYTSIINYIDYLTYLDSINFKIMSILQKHKCNLAYDTKTLYIKNEKK